MSSRHSSTEQMLLGIISGNTENEESRYYKAKEWTDEIYNNEDKFKALPFKFIPFPLCVWTHQLLLAEGKIFKVIDKKIAMQKLYLYSKNLIGVDEIAKAYYDRKNYKKKWFKPIYGFKTVENPIKEMQGTLMTLFFEYLKQIPGTKYFLNYLSSWNKFALTAAFYIATCRLTPEEFFEKIGGVLNDDEDLHHLLYSNEFWNGQTDFKPFYPIYTVSTLPCPKSTTNISMRWNWENGRKLGIKDNGIPVTCLSQVNSSFKKFTEILIHLDQTCSWKIFDLLEYIFETFDLRNGDFTFAAITKVFQF